MLLNLAQHAVNRGLFDVAQRAARVVQAHTHRAHEVRRVRERIQHQVHETKHVSLIGGRPPVFRAGLGLPDRLVSAVADCDATCRSFSSFNRVTTCVIK